MSADIFVPASSTADALVSPLHTVTYLTSEKNKIECILCDGLDMEASGWQQPSKQLRSSSDDYFGFTSEYDWQYCIFYRSGKLSNIQILVLHVGTEKPQLRPAADGRFFGAATIGFPMQEIPSRIQKMQTAGAPSTVGMKELEFTNTEGQTYVSREVHFLSVENIFLLGVQRPDAFVPVGAIDAATDIGAPAYSARCVEGFDKVADFTLRVLGYEIRRDMQMNIGPRSGLLMEEGIPERFAQAFAPGSGTGYLVFLEHGGQGIRSNTPSLGPPNRGIGMWSFSTRNLDKVHSLAVEFGARVTQLPQQRNLPHLGHCRSMIVEDPDGFPIEVFEAEA